MAGDQNQSLSGVEDIQPHVFSAATPRIASGPVFNKTTSEAGPGPIAIISDIHANLEALNAVLADIEGRGVTRIVCLGDVVGYGPNPLECMDIVMTRCEFSLMGNHDFAIFYEPANFNPAAENASFWTRSQFDADKDIDRRNNRWRYLGSMPTRMANERFVCFHGSPRRPINEYVFAADIYSAPAKMAAIFDRIPRICFVGHTHVPGVFVPDPDFYAPEEVDNNYRITEERAMINVGSVGQPRDRNPNASYVILHDETVEFARVDADRDSGSGSPVPQKNPTAPGGSVQFIRVPYDVQTTVNKIKAIDALDNFLGTRLIDGR